MLVVPGIIWGENDEDDEEDDDDDDLENEENSDDESSDFSDNENFVVENFGLGGIQDPFCIIQ